MKSKFYTIVEIMILVVILAVMYSLVYSIFLKVAERNPETYEKLFSNNSSNIVFIKVNSDMNSVSYNELFNGVNKIAEKYNFEFSENSQVTEESNRLTTAITTQGKVATVYLPSTILSNIWIFKRKTNGH